MPLPDFPAFPPHAPQFRTLAVKTATLILVESWTTRNVWTPEWPPKHGLPVMVWLHGGNNEVGSGAQSMYNGVSLTARGVVLVTTNYRLGALGFSLIPNFRLSPRTTAQAITGSLDQIAALFGARQHRALWRRSPECHAIW